MAKKRSHADEARRILRRMAMNDFENLDDSDAEGWSKLGESLSRAGEHASRHGAGTSTGQQVDADFAATGRTDDGGRI